VKKEGGEKKRGVSNSGVGTFFREGNRRRLEEGKEKIGQGFRSSSGGRGDCRGGRRKNKKNALPLLAALFHF